jgi:hypothetical protein
VNLAKVWRHTQAPYRPQFRVGNGRVFWDGLVLTVRYALACRTCIFAYSIRYALACRAESSFGLLERPRVKASSKLKHIGQSISDTRNE